MPAVKNWWGESILNWRNWGGGAPMKSVEEVEQSTDIEIYGVNNPLNNSNTEVINPNSATIPLTKRVTNVWNYSPLNPFNIDRKLAKFELSKSDFIPSTSFKPSLYPEELKIIEMIENSGVEVFMLPDRKYQKINMGIINSPHGGGKVNSIGIADFPHKGSFTFSSKLITSEQNTLLSHVLIHEFGHIKGPQIHINFIDKIIGIKPVINEVMAENYVYIWAVKNGLSEQLINDAFNSQFLKNDYSYLKELSEEQNKNWQFIKKILLDNLNPLNWFRISTSQVENIEAKNTTHNNTNR